MLVICIMTKMAFHLYAGGAGAARLLGWDVMSVVALAAVIIAVVTMVGGFSAVAYTDSLQSAIMILGCGLMLFIGLTASAGGMH